MMADLQLTALEMSVVFSAFTLAYSLFEVPSGWLGDVKGPRRVLTRIVLWWSAFTMLTGAAQGFRSLVVIRFLFGAGEAGAFPNMARSLSRWFPLSERGRANGVMLLGSRVGGMISVPLALLVITSVGLARLVRDLRPHRRGVGRGLARVVSRSAGGPSRDLSRGSGVDPAGRPGVAPPHRRRRGGRCSAREISTPFARCISRSATGCISTSPGCPRI